MKKRVKEKLRLKGWSEADLIKAESINETHKIEDKSESRKEMNKLMYWIALLIITTCNLGIALFLVPFLIVLGSGFSTIVVIIMGLIFGTLFSFIVKDIEHLEKHHHLFAGLIMPAVAVINIGIMVRASNFFAELLELEIYHNPLVMSLLYLAAFVLPYFFIVILDK